MKKESAKTENRKKVKNNQLIMNMEAQETGIVHFVNYALKSTKFKGYLIDRNCREMKNLQRREFYFS